MVDKKPVSKLGNGLISTPINFIGVFDPHLFYRVIYQNPQLFDSAKTYKKRWAMPTLN